LVFEVLDVAFTVSTPGATAEAALLLGARAGPIAAEPLGAKPLVALAATEEGTGVVGDVCDGIDAANTSAASGVAEGATASTLVS